MIKNHQNKKVKRNIRRHTFRLFRLFLRFFLLDIEMIEKSRQRYFENETNF